MLRSLYSGVSGMKGFQTKMDVLANNIANVNTTSFKSSRVRFQDMLSQTVANAQGPSSTGGPGGVNARQVGLGVKVGSIDAMMENGNLQATNRELDFAIEGNGFFTIGTRFDGEEIDSLATEFLYTRDGGFFRDSAGTLVNANGQKILGFIVEEDGTVGDINAGLVSISIPDKVDPTDVDSPQLQSYTIDGAGTVTAIYGGEDPKVIGKIALTTFTNPEGLEKKGNNNYTYTNNSGTPALGIAGDPGFGVVRQGFLEMSNVDLANEFTEMVIASRAYSANSRSITTSDEMLQELINLKR